KAEAIESQPADGPLAFGSENTREAVWPETIVTLRSADPASFVAVTVCSPGDISERRIGAVPTARPSMLRRAPAGSAVNASLATAGSGGADTSGKSMYCETSLPAFTCTPTDRESAPRCSTTVWSPTATVNDAGVIPALLPSTSTAAPGGLLAMLSRPCGGSAARAGVNAVMPIQPITTISAATMM